MDLVRRILRTFAASALSSVEQFEVSIGQGDGAGLSRAAHLLKSSAANVGADALSAVCRRLEVLGREDRIDEAITLLEEARGEHRRALAQIEDILQETA
jgi:HPt (histidine-containing phosphotransfer) domain-containing protein